MQHELCARLHNDFLDVVSKPLDEQAEVLLTGASKEFKVSLLTSGCSKLVDQALKQPIAVQSLCNVLRVDHLGVAHALNFSTICASEDVIMAAQKQSVLHLAEKVFRAEHQQMVQPTLHLRLDVPKLPWNIVQHSGSGEGKLVPGWYQQPAVDLLCVYVIGQTVKHQHENGAQKAFDRTLRQQCHEVISAEAMLSPRLKSLFKKINGAKAQHAKVAWDLMRGAHDAFNQQLDCNVSADVVNGWITRLAAATEKGADEIYDAMADIYNTHASELRMVALTYGHTSVLFDENIGDAELAVAAPKLLTTMLKCLDVALKEWHHHAAVFADTTLREEGPDNTMPDSEDVTEKDKMEWSNVVLGLLLEFKTEADAVVFEAKARCSCHVKISKMMSGIEFSDVADVVGTLSGVWTKHMRLQHAKACFSKGSPGCEIQVFADVAAANSARLDKVITAYVNDALSKGGTVASSAMRAAQELQGCLPEAVGDIVTANCRADCLVDMAARLTAGKKVGLLEISEMLEGMHQAKQKATAMLTARPELGEAEEKLRADWVNQLKLYNTKIDAAEKLLDKFEEAWAGSKEAICAWDFQTHEWVISENENAEKDALAKKLAQTLPQYDIWTTVTERMLGVMAWSSPEEKGNVDNIRTALEALIDRMKEAAQALAATCVASVIANFKDEDSDSKQNLTHVLKFIVDLKVTQDMLPNNLRMKLDAVRKDGSTGVPAASAPSAQHSESPSAANIQMKRKAARAE